VDCTQETATPSYLGSAVSKTTASSVPCAAAILGRVSTCRLAAEALVRLVVQARPALVDNVGSIFRRWRRRRSMTMVVR
jgi:hypothetical protein